MSTCKWFENCRYFQISGDADNRLCELYRERYCEDGWTECARHRIAAARGADNVPAGLHPSMILLAEEIILRG